METLNWIYILYLFVGIPVVINLFIIARKDNSLSILMFGIALFAFLTGIGIDYAFDNMEIAREWGDLIAVTTTLSGLFIEIRDSKPVFARFPMYLTFLPFITIVFYPLVIESEAIKDLLKMIYQGGAIVVAILVISINQFLYKQRGFLLTACIIITGAYISFWFLDEITLIPGKEIGKIMFAFGIIVATIGFRKISELLTS